MPEDEFFDMFHFAPFIVEYLVDQPVEVLLGLRGVPPETLPMNPRVRDGDAILRTADALYMTATLPPTGVLSTELWRIGRIELVPRGERLVSADDPSFQLDLQQLGDQRVVRARQDLGRWTVEVWQRGNAEGRRLGDLELSAGTTVTLGSADGEVDHLLLTRGEREVIR